MDIREFSVVVTGGASGLGRATAQRLAAHGAHVVISDIADELGAQTAADVGATYVKADVTSEDEFAQAHDAAEAMAPLRGLVHCAGRGAPLRVVGKDGAPGDLATFEGVVRLNLIGSFNVLRLAAARMATNEIVDGDRGACVLTASVAAFEGQIGQTPYASSKAGIVGLTLCAARDLSSRSIRVCCIAPGIMDTPLLGRLPAPVRESLAASVPHPRRLGSPSEFAGLAHHILENGYLNGETIRLDGAIRMAPK
jgi:NAD(P)-dependent dehydrogenase (short-subunit alcohol dehydrogenase family)